MGTIWFLEREPANGDHWANWVLREYVCGIHDSISVVRRICNERSGRENDHFVGCWRGYFLFQFWLFDFNIDGDDRFWNEFDDVLL